VDSISTLSDQSFERYSRQIALNQIGYEGQLKIREAKVCVVGLGGLGVPCAMQLVAMGAGLVRLVDRDVVEISNLHRQYLYDSGSIGYPKVEVAAEKLAKINPEVELEPLTVSVNPDTAVDVVRGIDIVVDGLDSVSARYAINRACIELGVPYVYGSAIETMGVASTIIAQQTPCLECFFPSLNDEELPKCAIDGIHPSVLNIVSGIQISEAVKIITGKKSDLAGKLLFFDSDSTSFDYVPITRQDECQACGVKRSPLPVTYGRKIIEDICSREGKRVFVISPKENLRIDVETASSLISENNLRVELKGSYGLGFSYDRNIKFTLLDSGVAVILGADTKETALNAYKEVTSLLQIPWQRIETKLAPVPK